VATPYIAVIGASRATPELEGLAEAVGAALGRAGAIVLCGGGPGVMAAAARGAAGEGATVVGILPGEDRSHANRWVSVALPTGMGDLRNGLIVRACDAAIAIGGAYGTLSEIALALAQGVPVVGLSTWEIDGVQVMPDPAAAVARALELAASRAPR
jgi:uncharacterized protein (TIGR00725 family)